MADEVAAEVCSSNTALTSNSKLEYNKTRLISVEFPGLVQNPSHMIECLGGEEELSKVFCNQTRRLPMTFRPQDPYSKVMCGDRQPSTSLLLRVRRRKKKSTASEEEGKHEYQQEVLGVVDTTYR